MGQLLEVKESVDELKQKLVDQQVIFDNILEGTLAGYWDWYVQEGSEYLSPSFKKMFGYEDHELENKPETWQALIHPEDLELVFENYNKHVSSRGEYPFDNEVRYYHKDGSIVWVSCKGKVIQWDKDWKPIRMVGCHVDITPLKNAELARNYTIKLEQKNKELEQFAYVASHDLQEPLRTVTSYVELLNSEHRNELTGNAPLYMEFVSNATKRMSDLIKGLLDHSRLGRNKKLVEIDCNTIINSIEFDLSRIIGETKAIINYTTLPTIKGYRTEIRLLFQNLISNAIKFRNPDRPPIIKIQIEQKADHWLCSVKDNGIGIDLKYKDRIFLIFQRLHLKRDYEGSGIGLAHCQKIVDLHEGEIWVNSELGVGSDFYFTISRDIKEI